MLQCPAHAVFDKVLFQIHQLVLLDKRHLWLNHPELCQVARSVAVLSTESRTEGIDLTQCHSSQLTLQLTRYGQTSLFAEEIVTIVDLTLLVLLEVVEVFGSHLEHLSCTLAVTSGDDWGVEIEESVLMEVLVDSHCHVVANTEHSAEGVGTWAEVCDGAQILHAQAFLLQWILLWVGGAIHLQFGQLNLYGLTATLASYLMTSGRDT